MSFLRIHVEVKSTHQILSRLLTVIEMVITQNIHTFPNLFMLLRRFRRLINESPWLLHNLSNLFVKLDQVYMLLKCSALVVHILVMSVYKDV